ncbi:MAG TPA: DUF5996 family protein [Candidatus Solibacter sp.]|nr:DUF5996 family protein [Candidatus Solibacter sp.]
MNSHDWPPLPFREWATTCDTLHMWTQIVGKTRLVLTPLQNHWWNVPLYVTARGLSTSPIPYERMTFEMEFDFIEHQLDVRTTEGKHHSIPLFPRSVADFYGEYMACLRSLGIQVNINRTPAEFSDTTPFDQDHHHASYDTKHVENFRRILVNTDQILKEFRSRFLGKCSPVHFFWGSFDLAVTCFSGRTASLPANVDSITREAYSHEVISFGFWPGDQGFQEPAFYSYTKPAPPGLEKEIVRPEMAHWDPKMGEFILKYDDARTTKSPDQALMDFCQSTYEAGANLAHWDRKALERQRWLGFANPAT